MAMKFFDRIKDTTTSTGTGTITVSGTPPVGFQTLHDRLVVGDRFYYCIAGQGTAEWETGYGTYSAANQFTRDTVEDSSNSGNPVTFSAGTKDVLLTVISDRLQELIPKGAIQQTLALNYLL